MASSNKAGSLVGCLPGGTAVLAAPAPPFAGCWHLQGRRPDRDLYQGSAAIRREGEIWRASWGLESQPKLYSGAGLPYGRSLVTSRSPASETTAGVVVYSRADDGSLSAVWNRDSLCGNLTGTGEATARGPIDGFAGSYEIRYQAPDGKLFPPQLLVIERQGESYALEWSSLAADGSDCPQPSLTGAGILLDQCHLAAGWAEPNIASEVILYEPTDDGDELAGRWATESTASIGEESLRRVEEITDG